MPPAEPRGRGRPEFKPTADHRALVKALTGYGIPQEEICKLIINPDCGEPIGQTTLRAKFRQELDQGLVTANSRVMTGLFKNATTEVPGKYPGGIPVAQIFWLKTRARWSVNPTPPPPEQPMDADTNIMDAARRIAFALELAASAKKVEPRTINVTPRKVDA